MEPDQKGPAPRRLAAHDGERIGSITVTPALRGGDGFYLRSSPMLSSVAPLHLSAVFSPPPVSALAIRKPPTTATMNPPAPHIRSLSMNALIGESGRAAGRERAVRDGVISGVEGAQK